MANRVISGNVGSASSGIVVSYVHSKLGAVQFAVSDASGNHSAALPAGNYTVSAVDPAGLLLFSSVSVSLDGAADATGINLRSRAKNASNAQEGGF